MVTTFSFDHMTGENREYAEEKNIMYTRVIKMLTTIFHAFAFRFHEEVNYVLLLKGSTFICCVHSTTATEKTKDKIL